MATRRDTGSGFAITVRVARDQKREIARRARAYGLTVGEYIRRSALGIPMRLDPAATPEEPEVA